MAEHEQLLNTISSKYGVEKQILLAIWGLESTFGKNKGDKDVIRSLATMAYTANAVLMGANNSSRRLKFCKRVTFT